jgi:hypothetical protein
MVFKLFGVALVPFVALAGSAVAVGGVVLGSWWMACPRVVPLWVRSPWWCASVR